MCEIMKTEPIESEIPIGIEDFPPDIQYIFQIYYQLSDKWEGMSGTYMGKDYNLLPFLFNINEIDDKSFQREIFQFLLYIDNAAKKYYSEKQKNERRTREASSKTGKSKRG